MKTIERTEPIRNGKIKFANLASKVYIRLAFLKTGLKGHTLELVNQAIQKQIPEGIEWMFSDGSKLQFFDDGGFDIIPQ